MAQADLARDRSYVLDAGDRTGCHRGGDRRGSGVDPGATVFKRINPLYPIVATTYPVIGIHFHGDKNPQVVKYSQNALMLTGPYWTAWFKRATLCDRTTAKS